MQAIVYLPTLKKKTTKPALHEMPALLCKLFFNKDGQCFYPYSRDYFAGVITMFLNSIGP